MAYLSFLRAYSLAFEHVHVLHGGFVRRLTIFAPPHTQLSSKLPSFTLSRICRSEHSKKSRYESKVHLWLLLVNNQQYCVQYYRYMSSIGLRSEG